MKIWMALLITMLCSHASAIDRSVSFDFRKKAESKNENRWTLQDWLAQKERNRMMDLWLAMYAPSPYEFFIEGGYLSYAKKVDPLPDENFSVGKLHLGAYATLIGIEAEYSNNTQESFNDLSGSLNLRILGNAVQGTHLIIQYGQRTREISNGLNNERISQQFAGADLNIYLNRQFGLMGSYQNYFSITHANLGEVSGSKAEGGLFIDFSAVRVFGVWYSEKTTTDQLSSGGVRTDTQRTGVMSGLRFFF